MIQVLKALFERPDGESEESDQRNLRLAAAALLVETVRAEIALEISWAVGTGIGEEEGRTHPFTVGTRSTPHQMSFLPDV